MICHEYRAIFIHIQKTGGDSVSTALGMSTREEDKHCLARDLKNTCREDIWSDYFKFAFVRNPWARLVSWYGMIDSLRPNFAAGQKLNRFQTHVLERAGTFAEFLENLDEDFIDVDGPKWIFRNQIDYLVDADDRLLVDFVGRTERLRQDFAVIKRHLPKQPPDLGHINRGRRGPYTDYYTPRLARLVARRYERDIERFGYRFED